MFRNMLSKATQIYTVFISTTAVLSFAVLILVGEYFKNYVNITVEILQLFCAVVSLGGILGCINARKDLMLPKIVLQSLVCFTLGQIYLVLHIYIKGYEQDGIFSISDISWIGFYLFLLTACRIVFNQEADFKDKSYRKINVISLFAPIFIISLNIALYLSGDSLFYTVIYTVPTSFLGYFTLRLVLSQFKNRIFNGFRYYHMIVGLILLIDNLTCLVMDKGFEDAEYIFKFCFAMLILVIPPAVYKGVQQWPR